MARLNGLGFPRGFPIKSNSAAGEALQRNGIFLPFFFVRFSKYSFYDSAHRLDTLAPPSLRIDIQGDAARTTGVPHVVTGNLFANLIGKNKIVRFAEILVRGPHLLYCRE